MCRRVQTGETPRVAYSTQKLGEARRCLPCSLQRGRGHQGTAITCVYPPDLGGNTFLFF